MNLILEKKSIRYKATLQRAKGGGYKVQMPEVDVTLNYPEDQEKLETFEVEIIQDGRLLLTSWDEFVSTYAMLI